MSGDKFSARTWHRKASRPVSVWMLVFIAVGLTHTLIPEARWVMVHIFTLGVVTNSIVVWSQNLTERFLQARLGAEHRPPQLLRIRLLNAAIVLVIAGQLSSPLWHLHWVLTAAGAVGVAALMAWHAVSLARQIAAVEKAKRFRPAAFGYVGSALFLVVGALFGATLAAGLEGTWQSRVLAAHTYLNVGGFVGLAALGSLTVLMPAMWRVHGVRDRARGSVAVCGLGVLVAAIGALAGVAVGEAAGLVLFIAGWVWSLEGWVATILAAEKRCATYPSLSALAANFWFVAALTVWAVQCALGREMAPPTLMLLLGFVAQLLIGTMSYLLPTTVGGGPAAVRAGLGRLNSAGVFRFVAYNVALVVWCATDMSWLRVVASLVVFGVLVAFIPLTGAAVKAQRAVIVAKARGGAPTT